MYEDAPDNLTSDDDKKYTWKISSWNVDGIRAWVKKEGVNVSMFIATVHSKVEN